MNCYTRLRPKTPRHVNGKPVKYESPVGKPVSAYFPVGSLPKLNDGESPIFITEGEKKALALSQLGKAAIGLGGVYGWKVKDREQLVANLAAFPWKRRCVYLVFDHDPKPETRRDVESAGRRLARVLRESGVPAVYWIELPPGLDGEKQGVDDFLVARGKNGGTEFQMLVQEAGEMGEIKGNKMINPFPPSIPQALYHGPIGAFIKAVDPLTEAHPMGILAHLLPAIGTLIGPKVYIEGGGRQPPRVNTVLVGPTNSGRKGTSFGPVDALIKKVDETFWSKQRLSGLSSGEGLIAYVGEEKKYQPDETELETVQREKRLYVVESEFSRVFANKNRKGNVLSQVIREAFDSGDLHTMTVEPRHAIGAHVSITGHITPEELSHCLTSVDKVNGFGNRFLWFVVKSDKVLPNPPRIPDEVFNLLTPILKALKHWADGESKVDTEIEMDAAAKARWKEVYEESLRWDHEGLGLAKTMVSRGSAMVMRLALIYACVDAPIKKSIGIWKLNAVPIIKQNHLEAALAVWEYCEESAYKLFGGKSETKFGEKVLKLLKEHDGPMTTTELNLRLSPGQRKEATSTLEALAKEGLIVSHKEKTGTAGRPTTRWSLPPE